MEFFDSMNMVEHEAVVGEEETIPAYSELIPATGELNSLRNIDFYPQVDSMNMVEHEVVVGEEETIPAYSELIPPTGELYSPRNIDSYPQVDSMNMVEHEAVVGEEETIPACYELIPMTGALYSPMNFDFHPQVQSPSPFVDLSISPLWNFQDNNYDFSATGGTSILTTEVLIHHDRTSGILGMCTAQRTRSQLILQKMGIDAKILLKTLPRLKQIWNRPLEAASGKVLEEAISVKTTKFSGDNKLDSNHESPQGPQDYPNGGDMMQIDSSEQQPAVEFDVRLTGGIIVSMGESDTPVAGSERKNAKKISMRKHRNIETLISPELLQQLKGRMTLDEITQCTGASRSAFKRFCRKHEIPRWPRKRNESVQGVQGAPSQPCLAKDPLNDGIGQPAKLNKPNQQNLSRAFRQMELSPSAPYCVSNTLASMQTQISAERMLTEVPGCLEYLKFLHHSKKGKGVLESNNTVRSCSNPTAEHTVASVAPTMPQVIAMQDVSTMIIKVRYRSEILRFPLSFSSGKRELEENISKRLKLKLGTFRITYQDADGDWVGIYCDEDLQLCMGDSKRLGNSTIIMSVES